MDFIFNYFLTLRCFKDKLMEVRIFIETGLIIKMDLETKMKIFGWVRKTNFTFAKKHFEPEISNLFLYNLDIEKQLQTLNK